MACPCASPLWSTSTIDGVGPAGEIAGVDLRGRADIATIGLLHERAVRDQVTLSEQLQSSGAAGTSVLR
jgi:hypothetical protein